LIAKTIIMEWMLQSTSSKSIISKNNNEISKVYYHQINKFYLKKSLVFWSNDKKQLS